MKIFYDHNIATRKLGLILVNTNAKDLPWKNAEQNGRDAKALFEETFGFDEVIVLVDKTKAEIIEAFEEL